MESPFDCQHFNTPQCTYLHTAPLIEMTQQIAEQRREIEATASFRQAQKICSACSGFEWTIADEDETKNQLRSGG